MSTVEREFLRTLETGPLIDYDIMERLRLTYPTLRGIAFQMTISLLDYRGYVTKEPVEREEGHFKYTITEAGLQALSSQ